MFLANKQYKRRNFNKLLCVVFLFKVYLMIVADSLTFFKVMNEFEEVGRPKHTKTSE